MSTICHPLKMSLRSEQQVVIKWMADSWLTHDPGSRWLRMSPSLSTSRIRQSWPGILEEEGSRWNTNIALLLSSRNRFVCLLINCNWLQTTLDIRVYPGKLSGNSIDLRFYIILEWEKREMYAQDVVWFWYFKNFQKRSTLSTYKLSF